VNVVRTSNPVPELKHVGHIDAKGFAPCLVGGERDKVLGNACFLRKNIRRKNKEEKM